MPGRHECTGGWLTNAAESPSSLRRCLMRPLSWIGIALIAAGGIILIMRGVSYTKSRNDVELGPFRVATVEKGFVPPIAGVVTVLVGACLLFIGRRRQS